MGIIGSIIIGCLAGFCAGKLMKGGGMGFVMPAGHTVGRCLRTAWYCHCWCSCHSLDCITHQEVNTTCKEGLRSSLLSNLLSKKGFGL